MGVFAQPRLWHWGPPFLPTCAHLTKGLVRSLDLQKAPAFLSSGPVGTVQVGPAVRVACPPPPLRTWRPNQEVSGEEGKGSKARWDPRPYSSPLPGPPSALALGCGHPPTGIDGRGAAGRLVCSRGARCELSPRHLAPPPPHHCVPCVLFYAFTHCQHMYPLNSTQHRWVLHAVLDLLLLASLGLAVEIFLCWSMTRMFNSLTAGFVWTHLSSWALF